MSTLQVYTQQVEEVRVAEMESTVGRGDIARDPFLSGVLPLGILEEQHCDLDKEH